MQFRYDPEHEELRSVVRRFLDDAATEQATRATMHTALGWDPDVVKRLAGELGVFGLAIPEEYGGSGYGVVELGIIFQEAGRVLLCAPLLSAAMATTVLLAAEDADAAGRLLPGIAAGDSIAAVATREPGQAWDAAPTSTVATNGAIGWTVSGTKTWVVDGHAADTLIVAAATDAGPSLFLVDAEAVGVTRRAVESVDFTRRFATVELDTAPAVPLGAPGAATTTLQRPNDLARALLAAEQVGLAERCLEQATEYAKTREQFGQPIGAFQAIKHKLATVAMEQAAAASAAMYALWIADQQPERLSEAAVIAAYSGSEAAALAAAENIQVHGGIGATWEHSAHLYLRRASVDRVLFGDPQSHLEELAEGLTQQA